MQRGLSHTVSGCSDPIAENDLVTDFYIGGHAESDLNTATEESRDMMITMSLKGDWTKEREVKIVDFVTTDADIQLCFIL